MNQLPSLDILVIEDDPAAQANLRDILELDAHRVETAATAAEALARDDWSRIAAIILDRRLPDALAEQILPDLRRLAPEAPVIIVTGYSDLPGVIAALRQGVADYILKPLNADALRASLSRLAERRRLALAKERSESAFRHLVEAAECLIVILRPDHTILYFSPFAERLTGYSSAEVLGRDYLGLFLPDPERRAVAEELAGVLADRPMHGYEYPVVCRDDSSRWLVWNARLLPDHEGGPAILKVGQDITNLKQAQERALQAERLAAIGQMMTGLAHESRNGLQRIQACLEMLVLTVPDRLESLDLIARIQKAQDHLRDLYEDVRGYAAPIKLEYSLCNLDDIWREAWAHLDATRAAKEAQLREETAGVDLRCLVDPSRVRQVFHNILDNALAAGPRRGEVTIAAEETTLGGQPALRIALRDNGPGLNAEQRQRVFEPFYTTKAKGTGLGMPIAQRIVEAHGGQLAVGDTPAPGAVFLITLPRGLP
jgi:two-component system, LuxR family, sensor kinase FixL